MTQSPNVPDNSTEDTRGILDCVQRGDLKGVERGLSKPEADINVQDESYGETPFGVGC
jgi:hypothetical protein